MSKPTRSQTLLPGHDFFNSYQPAPNVFDEVLDANRNLRSQWQPFSERLTQIGNDGLERRWKQIRRMIRENGIAYSAFGDSAVRETHLQLDPVPQLIPSHEWRHIEQALCQRADLLNRLLADLYGPRSLISEGVLPPEVLFNHPHYHLPFHELPVAGGRHLHFYAAEIIRSPQGHFWIRSDRTDSPGGSGFSLENRIAVSRAFPNTFRRHNVQRLAPYFIAVREHLTRLSPSCHERPHIAILSSGAGSPRYFEDSFLARYLGFTLVEANDLVVRSGRVMLKTLAGLAPIDVIVRQHPGHLMDPLELGGNARVIPGLLQVIRDQRVVVVNAPGSGLVESPIFMAFLPRIARALTGSDLLMPGIASWWGGESLDLMLDRIDELDLQPAYRVRSGSSRLDLDTWNVKTLQPENMTREERINLLRANPKAWVGQEKVARSSAPVWRDGKLQSAYVTMRTFLAATESSWLALPGGLVRMTESPYFEPQRKPFEEGGTKDAWVLNEKPVVPTTLLSPPDEPLQPVRSSGFLPSRITENLFWLGRYLERADASARLLRAVAMKLTDESDPADTIELPQLIRALALSGQIDIGYANLNRTLELAPLEQQLPAYALNHQDSDSLRFHVDQIVSLAGTVRDRLSSDGWRIVQEMSSSCESSSPENCDLVDLLDIIDTLVVGLAAFSGFVSENMTRTHAYNFLNIGRRLERAIQISTLIGNCFAKPHRDSVQLLESVLEVMESRLTYRSRYYANLQLGAVLDLLLMDETNPRSLNYQLMKLQANLEALAASLVQGPSIDLRLASEAIKSLQSNTLTSLTEVSKRGEREILQNLLETVESRLGEISISLSNRFFVHSGPVHQMVVDPESTRLP